MTTTTTNCLRGREPDNSQTLAVTECGSSTGFGADQGYTLIELILVVLILGVLAAGIVLSVGGIRTEAADSGCGTDQRVVANAVEAYFAQHGDTVIPATGTGADQFEQTLVVAGLLRDVSEYHHVAATGAITPEADSEC